MHQENNGKPRKITRGKRTFVAFFLDKHCDSSNIVRKVNFPRVFRLDAQVYHSEMENVTILRTHPGQRFLAPGKFRLSI